MKFNSLISFSILLSILISCQSSETPETKIIGIWDMEKVYEYEKDVTEKHNPENSRWIEFKADGTFESGGKPFGRNTGTCKIDNVKSILYINSNIEDDDSEWNISFDGNKTIWTGIGHPRKESTKLILARRTK